MILGITQNITPIFLAKYNRQKNRYNTINNHVSFAGLGAVDSLTPFRKTHEILTKDTIQLLSQVAELLNHQNYELKRFIDKQFLRTIARKVVRKWDTNGIEAFIEADIKSVTSLSNALIRKSRTPLRKVVPKCADKMPGDYQVIEGKKVFNIFMSQNGITTNSILLAKCSVPGGASFNDEVQRIIKVLLDDVKKPKVLK
jgi:hypothetical protein